MPSNQFVIAYHSASPVYRAEVAVRMGQVSRYVRNLHPGTTMRVSSVCGEHTGVIAWGPSTDTVRWPLFKSDGNRAVAWLNFPEHDALQSSVDPLALATRVTDPGVDVTQFGAPFACLYWDAGTLTVVNDALGLARLYRFSFDELTVWATRPGLAHIFAAEEVQSCPSAWAGMATLGWNLNGRTHFGDGIQVPGYTRAVGHPGRSVATASGYQQWVASNAESDSSWDGAAAGIARAMSAGQYFEREPIADLSGGKDSRVLAAAALRSGVTTHLRTLRTDHGEVETATRLVDLYDGPVQHEIKDVMSPGIKNNTIPLPERLAAAQIGHEGSLLPVTAIAGALFKGFAPLRVARFNGHGGESLQGGALYGGAWRDRLADQGPSGAIDRMRGMIEAPLATSTVGRARAMEQVQWRIEVGESMGISTAHGLLNYFYNSERMPFWSSSFSNRATLTPYYSSGLINHIARTFAQDTEYSRFHGQVLSDLVPAWASVPFYKPTGVVRRATKFFWETEDWTAIKRHIRLNVESLDNFDPTAIDTIVQEVDDGHASKALEVALARILWEQSAQDGVRILNKQVRECRAALDQLSAAELNSETDGFPS